ncbi:MAG: RAMP superfamily CRISPR-associated protein [Proteobacteria bacterium]|nr:RAMP superfamily CRISPR-associated protein [Pseudomonadota bacterium]
MPKLRTWFSGVLETQTALHVGTGTVTSTVTDAPILRGADGLPLIPGSSVKGALRSASERLLRALGHRACLVFGDQPPADDTLRCLTTDKAGRDLFFKLKGSDPLDEAELNEANRHFNPPPSWGQDWWRDFGQHEAWQKHLLEDRNALCRACLTWGSPFMAGRARVPDLRLRGDGAWAQATEIRDGVGLDRDTGTAADRIKFDLEALPAGARFDFDLIAEPEADRAVVALAVGELLHGNVPLGGRTTGGLGQVALTGFAIHEVDLADPAALVAYLTHGQRTSFAGQEAENRLETILATLLEDAHAA